MADSGRATIRGCALPITYQSWYHVYATQTGGDSTNVAALMRLASSTVGWLNIKSSVAWVGLTFLTVGF